MAQTAMARKGRDNVRLDGAVKKPAGAGKQPIMKNGKQAAPHVKHRAHADSHAQQPAGKKTIEKQQPRSAEQQQKAPVAGAEGQAAEAPQDPHAAGPAHAAAPAPNDQPSSRLCVKNLPKYTNEAALKKHFSAKGEVTDVKIIRTRDGTSRQMGFVGFKSEAEASAALNYFHNTYMDAMKIAVEYARGFKEAPAVRPWSKHSSGSSAHAKTAAAAAGDVDGSVAEAQALAKKLKLRAGKQGGGGVADELVANDPKLAEFLALMAPRSRAKLWANDELAPQQTLEDILAGERPANGEQRGDDDGGASTDDDEYQELPITAGSRGNTYKGVGPDSDDSGSDAGDGDSSGDEGEGVGAAAGGAKDAVVVSEGVSDLDYLRSRMRKWSDDDDADDDAGMTGHGDGAGAVEMGESEDEAEGGSEDEAGAGVRGAGAETKQGGVQAAGGGAVSAGVDAAEGHDVGPRGHEPILDPETAVRATSRLFMRNLGYGVTESDLMELAGRWGDVASVHLVIDRETKKSKGLAYVQYVMPDDAVQAYQNLDGIIYQGRLLHVLPSKAPPTGVVGVEWGAAGEGGDGDRSAAGSSYKAVKEEKRKADAGNRAAWNSLFMRPDTVQEAIAAHYGVSKSELMDARASGDLAVRVALGEAAVIQQTKTALAEQGVNVGALEAAAAAGGSAAAVKANVARSPTTLLVKNLPFTTTEESLVELFSKSGPVARLVLPPAHTLALVEFAEPQDARTAFKALAYKRFQHVPLYLEWAPRDIFTCPPPAPVTAAKPQPATAQQPAPASAPQATGGEAPQGVAGEDIREQAGEEEEEEEEDRTCSIYVKNLAFGTTDGALRKHFDKVVSEAGGVLHSARVSRRKHPTSGALLSAGFGFVEVDSPEVAAAVIAKLQNSMLDHHKLSLQLSKRKTDTAPAAGSAAAAAGKRSATAEAGDGGGQAGAGAGKKSGGNGLVATKLVVRNVAFEATRKDLVGLFSPFGHLKSCRLPKKFDGHHRGFAFVEFVTKQEAKNAVEGVTGTHLYGRRLVVEYAKEDGGLDELRAKTGAKFREEDAEVLGGPGGGGGGVAPAAKRMKRSL